MSMPLYTLIAHDRPDPQQRLTHRPAHLEHMQQLDADGRLIYGGPLVNANNQMVGSLIILQAESLEEAKATYAKDPYMKQKVFDRFDVIETKQVFPQTK
jgi:uncharacterized protein YciI